MSTWPTALACLTAVVSAVLLRPSGPGADRFVGSPESGHEAPTLDVAYALDLLSLALAGGAPLVGALDAVSQACGRQHVRLTLARVAAAMRWGIDDGRAWDGASPVWQPVGRAFVLAGRAGAAPARILGRTAADLRAAENDRIAAAGARAGTHVVLPLGLCFLPAFLLITVVPLVLGLVRPV